MRTAALSTLALVIAMFTTPPRTAHADHGAILEVEPEMQTRPSHDTASLDATVADHGTSDPQEGVRVAFEVVSGPNAGTVFDCTTDDQGTCEAMHSDTAGADGADLIRGWLDLDGDGTPNEADAGEARDEDASAGDTEEPDATDVVEVAWEVAPQRCPGLERAQGNHIVGTNGDDRLQGTGGTDIICGLGGDDELLGAAGDDLLEGGPGDDILDGGAGSDGVTYAGAPGPVQVHLADGEGRGRGIDTLSSIEILEGSAHDDTLTGGNGPYWITGFRGDDRLVGEGGSDTLWGGGGDDSLIGGFGGDTLIGHRGDDVIRGGPGHDLARGDTGSDRVAGHEGRDTLRGGAGRDRILGHKGQDLLAGGPRDDVVRGGPHADEVRGQAHDDLVAGGGGPDFLGGGPGDDTLRGGPGRDVCRQAAGTGRLLSCNETESRPTGAGPNPVSITFRLKGHLKAVADLGPPPTQGNEPSPLPPGECMSARHVRFQKKDGIRWETVREVFTNFNDRVAEQIPDRPGRYRALVPREKPNDEVCAKAISDVVRHRH